MSDVAIRDVDAPGLESAAGARQHTRRILVTDDSPVVRTLVERFLRTHGFDVVQADSGQAALDALAGSRFDLMLCDVQMPEMSGPELVPRALRVDPELAIVMLTSVNDAPTATEALSGGAYDYLVKPVQPEELQQTIDRALHKRMLLIEQRRVEQLIREEVALRTAELEREKHTLRALVLGLAETMMNVVEMRDASLRGHSQRVADLAALVAEELRLDAETVEHVRLAGRLHDLGKIGIREEVLRSPGRLSAEEYEHAKTHVQIGIDLLAPLAPVTPLGASLRFVHEHHERCDGTGYPRRLDHEHLSLGGRILAVANRFDALTSTRPFRAAITPEAALEAIATQAGTAFDPQVCEALHRVVTGRKSLVFI